MLLRIADSVCYQGILLDRAEKECINSHGLSGSILCLTVRYASGVCCKGGAGLKRCAFISFEVYIWGMLLESTAKLC